MTVEFLKNVNQRYECLTPNGFQPFSGLLKTPDQPVCQVQETYCTLDHTFIQNKQLVQAHTLTINPTPEKNMTVYDLVNAGIQHEFYINQGKQLSKNCSGLLLDEFAWVPNSDDFFTSVIPVISSGVSTRMVVVSTPNGVGNKFHQLWEEAEKGKNGFIPITVDWRAVPERNDEWKEAEIQRLGETRFQQEYECSFLASEFTLISLSTLSKIEKKKPVEVHNEGRLKLYHLPADNHKYFAIIDPARGIGKDGDYTVIQMIDITEIPYRQVAVYRTNTVKPKYIAPVVLDIASYYNMAYVLFELNKGADIASELYYGLEYENLIKVGKDKKTKRQKLGGGSDANLGLLQTDATKTKGCSTLKNMVESHKLILCDSTTIEELYTFIEKEGSYKAENGKHDDCVMPLVLFAWAASQNYFQEYIAESNESIEMDVDELLMALPFGLIAINGTEDQEEFEKKTQIDSMLDEWTEDDWNRWERRK